MKALSFSLDDIKDFNEDDNVDFAYAKLRFLADKNNSHKNPISEDVLRKCASTVLGKFVVAKFDKYSNDATTHEPDESIIGYVPPNSQVTFEKDVEHDKLFAVCEAVISKIYATDIYNLFKTENFRHVSSEFSAILERDEVENEPNETDNPILDFVVHGITVLGLKYKPSIKGADMIMMKFSEDEANDFYEKYSHPSIKSFAENRRKRMGESKLKTDSEEETKKMEDDKKTEEFEEPVEEKDEKFEEDEETDDKKEANDEDEHEEEKKFSLDSNLDVVAYNEMLKDETEEYKVLADEYIKESNANKVVEKYVAMAKEKANIVMQYEAVQKECEELKKFKQDKEDEEKKFAVEKIMNEVKEDIPTEKFEEFKTEGMACKFEEVSGFTNRIKAFAYEYKKANPKASKKKEEKDSFRFGFNDESQNTNKTVDDIYNRYL